MTNQAKFSESIMPRAIYISVPSSADPRDVVEHLQAVKRGIEEAQGDGLSLRDYFIAHAPAEPQKWFEPSVPPNSLATHLSSEMEKQRYIQWPSAWADAQLALREKGGSQ